MNRPGFWESAMRVLLTPSCWVQVNRYSEEWDAELWRLMGSHKFRSNNCEYTVMLGEAQIWVRNHPVASFHPYGNGGILAYIRPKRSTILAAHDKMIRDIYFQGKSE